MSLGGIISSAISGIVSGFVTPILNKWFPTKTAADQRAEDLNATVKQDIRAQEIQEAVHQKSDADLDSSLASRLPK